MHARQNTVEAFAIAIEHGADGVELDVRRTRDGAMIVHHEERAVPNADPFITQDLKAIKAATPWVPTLDEAWAAIGDSALMNIEIKNTVGQADFDQTRRIAGQVVEWIEANAARERVLVSSFDGIALKAVRDRDPGIHTGLLATIAVDPITAIEWATRDGNFSVNLPLATVLGDASRIVEAARPLQVLVWTVNDPHAALTLADAGIGGVFSDDPGLIVAAFAQR